MSNVNLEDVITDAVSDAQLPVEPSEPVDTPVVDPVVEDTPVEPVDAPEAPISDEATPEPTTTEVASPAARAAVASTPATQDEFEKKYGFPAKGPDGRENRLPHSRVKTMVEKAEKSAAAQFEPRIKEFETKVQDYEGRLIKVAEFEKIMVNDPTKFLSMLQTLPQYRDILTQPKATEAPATPAVVSEVPAVDEMPQPDSEGPDGTRVYSMEGLKNLVKWIKTDAKAEALKEVETKYKPLQDDWQAREQKQKSDDYYNNVIVPKINAQIEEARKWDLFAENETEIVKALDADKNLSLERAYQTVVFPKLRANRDEIRKQVIADMKKAPVSTSVAAGVVSKAPAASTGGKRDLEDIIREATQTIR